MVGKTKSAAAVTATLLFALGGVGAALAQKGPSSSDRQFMTKAAQGGMAEVELGELASKHAASPAVKQFGQHMVHDHSKANAELKSLASKKGVTLPKSLSSEDAQTKAKLEKLSGAAFDEAYMKDMVEDHSKDVSEFKKEANSADDPDLKTWAGKTLPTLEHHLQMATSTASKVGARHATR
jgi:putative membrane protein